MRCNGSWAEAVKLTRNFLPVDVPVERDRRGRTCPAAITREQRVVRIAHRSPVASAVAPGRPPGIWEHRSAREAGVAVLVNRKPRTCRNCPARVHQSFARVNQLWRNRRRRGETALGKSWSGPRLADRARHGYKRREPEGPKLWRRYGLQARGRRQQTASENFVVGILAPRALHEGNKVCSAGEETLVSRWFSIRLGKRRAPHPGCSNQQAHSPFWRVTLGRPSETQILAGWLGASTWW